MTPVSEVSPGVWRAQQVMGKRGRGWFAVNAYLVADGGEAMFVDTAWWYGSDTRHLSAAMAAAGVAPRSVTTIFLTHAHRDHSGWMSYLQELTGARPWLHRREEPTVRSMTGSQGLSAAGAQAWYRSHGVPAGVASAMVAAKLPDKPFDTSRVTWGASHDRLQIGSRAFEVIGCPGHTNGHACLFEPRTGLLFTGDALLPRGHGNPHVTCRPLTMPDPLTAYVSGLEQVRALGAALCLPGHGPAVPDADQLVADHLSYVETKLQAAEACLDGGGATVYDVARRIPWRGGSRSFDDLVRDELFLAFGDVLARLRRLETLGRAVASGAPVQRYARALPEE